jgi:peroxiredoxin
MTSANYEQLPASLPEPEDDGAAGHLPGTPLPPVALLATSGGTVNLARLGQPRAVLYVYPMTGTPGVPLIEGWDQIPGARGCTPETIGFRDHYSELAEAADRLAVPFPLLSDSDLVLADQLGLPTFTASDGVVRYKRLTLVVSNGVIEHVFYPVFPPDQHAADVVAWLRG